MAAPQRLRLNSVGRVAFHFKTREITVKLRFFEEVRAVDHHAVAIFPVSLSTWITIAFLIV